MLVLILFKSKLQLCISYTLSLGGGISSSPGISSSTLGGEFLHENGIT